MPSRKWQVAGSHETLLVSMGPAAQQGPSSPLGPSSCGRGRSFPSSPRLKPRRSSPAPENAAWSAGPAPARTCCAPCVTCRLLCVAPPEATRDGTHEPRLRAACTARVQAHTAQCTAIRPARLEAENANWALWLGGVEAGASAWPLLPRAIENTKAGCGAAGCGFATVMPPRPAANTKDGCGAADCGCAAAPPLRPAANTKGGCGAAGCG